MSDKTVPGISGIKLIKLTGSVNLPDDPSHPFKLEVKLSPSEFMTVAFAMLHGGSEELVLRSMTRQSIDDFIELNDLRSHPRLRHGAITGPDGVIEEFKHMRYMQR